MEKIQTYLQLLHENVELNICLKEDLSRQDNNLKNFGFIQVSAGSIGEKPCFWDNIDFFIKRKRKKFKKECGKELLKKGFNVDDTYNSIKILLQRAKKLNLLHFD